MTRLDDTLTMKPPILVRDPHTLRSRFGDRVAAARARTRQRSIRVSAREESPLLSGGIASHSRADRRARSVAE